MVSSSYEVSAPFFVYTNVNEWELHDLPSGVRSIKELEQHLEKQVSEVEHAFAFKLSGIAKRAVFHVQNLPKGSEVSSPEEAHQGQVNYVLIDEEVEILGFFSKENKGVFTHHDANVHMHLITKDKTKMGHLDELEIGTMQLYLPIE